MSERGRENPPIDESTYGGSAAETGGLYDDEGPTSANPEGDTMSNEEEREWKSQLLGRRPPSRGQAGGRGISSPRSTTAGAVARQS